MKFLQTLLIILLVIMTIRLLWRIFGKTILRWLGKKAMEKVQRNFAQQAGYKQENNQDASNSPKSKMANKNPRSKKVVGEYVDFEEID